MNSCVGSFRFWFLYPPIYCAPPDFSTCQREPGASAISALSQPFFLENAVASVTFVSPPSSFTSVGVIFFNVPLVKVTLAKDATASTGKPCVQAEEANAAAFAQIYYGELA